MAMPRETVSSRMRETQDVAEQIKTLEDQIAAQHRRIVELEAQRPSAQARIHEPTEQPSRRDLLRRAGQVGIAAAGAAGGMALLSQSAAATQGMPVIAGQTNTETATTLLDGAGATFSPILQATTIGTNATATAMIATSSFASDTGLVADGNSGGLGALGQTTSGVGLWATASAAGGVALVADGVAGRTPLYVVPAAAAGPPTANAHSRGDLWLDANGVLWVCLTSGTPGVFAPLQTGGANVSHFVKATNLQYLLTNSDGATWQDMDPTGLKVALTPLFNAQAVISIGADLWTTIPGLNQDVGVYIEGGRFGAAGMGTIVAWKESGGFAGTFSPNAAYVETSQPLVAGTAYTIKVRWKTNHAAGGGTIVAGAGPLPGSSAGGGVAGQFSPTRLAVTLIQDVPMPSVLSAPVTPLHNDPSQLPAGWSFRLPQAPSGAVQRSRFSA